MRIQDRGPQGEKIGSAGGASQSKKAAEGDAKAREAGASAQAGSVKLKVSAKARALAAESQVDEAKVARLKEAMENGSFKVDARAIAHKLVGEDA